MLLDSKLIIGLVMLMMIVTLPPETDNEDDAGGGGVDNGDDDNDDTHTNIITRVWTTWMRDARNIKDSAVSLQRCNCAFENMKFSL